MLTAVKCIIVLLGPLIAVGTAQAGALKGRVMDSETGSVIWSANVRVIELDTVVETSKRGVYEIKRISDGHYRVITTHVAYDRSDTLNVVVGGETVFDVRLRPMPWVIDDVVVTGTRSPHLLKNVPVQTEVVSRRDFQRTGAATVDEALLSSIGVTINDDLSGKGATIRGVMGDRVLVLIDGEREVGRVSGSLDLGQLSLANVDKIEIVKGTGSTLYGSDAMGGVINIITKKPRPDIYDLTIYGEYGSNGSFQTSGEIEYGDHNFGLNGGVRYYHTDGFDLDRSTPHTNGQDEIDRVNLDSKARYRLSDKWSITGSSRLMFERKKWIESEIWPGDLLFVYDDNESNNRYNGSLSFDYLSGDRYSMKLRFYTTFYDHHWDKVERLTGTWLDTSRTKDLFVEVAYSSNYVIGQNHVITYGFDYNYQDLTSTELSAEKEADQAGSGYLQYEYSPRSRWTFLPGVRYEYHRSFGSKVNPSLNVMYQPSEQAKLRGFVGYGFRAPSIKQQYFIFDHLSAGYVVFGGRVDLPDNIVPATGVVFQPLKDETSLNASISAELSYGTVGLHRITYFYNHLDDLIEFTMLGSDTKYWRGIYVYQNIERATTQGLEWESRVRLSPSVDLSFSYNYLHSLNLGTGEQLINRPTHTFKFYLTGFYEKWGVGASFWGTYNSRKLWVPRSNTGGNEGEPEWARSRTTFNFNLFQQLGGRTKAYVRLENLLDQVDLKFGYWPGFSVYAGLDYGMGIGN